jgi:large subunit ribosomal protein L7/L12
MTITNDDVVKALGEMSVMQVIALTKELEQKWGVKAEPPTVQVQPKQGPENQAVVKEEWNVILTSVPNDKKMAVIKSIRELLGLGLKESKELAEAAPKMVKEGVSKADADDLLAKLTAAGAVVEVK